MEKINIKINDILNITGINYKVKYIETCNDCEISNTKICKCIDFIKCGEKTHLGFKLIGFNNENSIKSK